MRDFCGEGETNFLLIEMKTQPDKIRSWFESNKKFLSLHTHTHTLPDKSHKWTETCKLRFSNDLMSEVHVNMSDPITSSYQISVLMQTGSLTAEIQEFAQKRERNHSPKQNALLHLIPLTDKNWIEKSWDWIRCSPSPVHYLTFIKSLANLCILLLRQR